jgi:hypothetical protein
MPLNHAIHLGARVKKHERPAAGRQRSNQGRMAGPNAMLMMQQLTHADLDPQA